MAQSKQELAEFKNPETDGDPTSLAKYSNDDIKKVQRIQSCYRQHRAKKEEQPLEERACPPQSNGVSDEAQNPGENLRVKELETKLGPFEHEDPPEDGVQREKRPEALLDNGAKYDGQW